MASVAVNLGRRVKGGDSMALSALNPGSVSGGLKSLSICRMV